MSQDAQTCLAQAQSFVRACETTGELVPSLRFCQNLIKTVRDNVSHDTEGEELYWPLRVLLIYAARSPRPIDRRVLDSVKRLGELLVNRFLLTFAYDLLAHWSPFSGDLAQFMHARLGDQFWRWRVQKYIVDGIVELERNSLDSAAEWVQLCINAQLFQYLPQTQEAWYTQKTRIPAQIYSCLDRYTWDEEICVNHHTSIDFVTHATGRASKNPYGG